MPVDAVTGSASSLDPHISVANARIQAPRVAEERGIDLDEVLDLVDDHTDGRALGFLGEPGVNVLELNLALDERELGPRRRRSGFAVPPGGTCGGRFERSESGASINAGARAPT